MHACRNQAYSPHQGTLLLDWQPYADGEAVTRAAERLGFRVQWTGISRDIPISPRMALLNRKAQKVVYENPADFTWLVDDDILPDVWCLSDLLDCMNDTNAAAVGARLVNVQNYAPAFPPGQSWKHEPECGAPVRSPMLSQACLLAETCTFLDTWQWSHKERFGEDLVMTAQMELNPARRGCWFHPGATCLHVRIEGEETWRKTPLTIRDLWDGLEAAGINKEQRQAFAAKIGENPEP